MRVPTPAAGRCGVGAGGCGDACRPRGLASRPSQLPAVSQRRGPVVRGIAPGLAARLLGARPGGSKDARRPIGRRRSTLGGLGGCDDAALGRLDACSDAHRHRSALRGLENDAALACSDASRPRGALGALGGRRGGRGDTCRPRGRRSFLGYACRPQARRGGRGAASRTSLRHVAEPDPLFQKGWGRI